MTVDVSPPAAVKPERIEELRRQAREAERRGDWLKACWRYDDLLRIDRTNAKARAGSHRCQRRFQIAARHGDRGYRDALVSLEPSQALDVYEQVLKVVGPVYVDRRKSDLGSLFRHGLTELKYALDNEKFVREYLPGATPAALQNFRSQSAGLGRAQLRQHRRGPGTGQRRPPRRRSRRAARSAGIRGGRRPGVRQRRLQRAG